LEGSDIFDGANCYKTIRKTLNNTVHGLADLRQVCEAKFSVISEEQSGSHLKKSIDRMCPYLLKTYRYLISIEIEEDVMRKSINEYQLWFIVRF
jgi:hypothetical protein